MPKILFSMKKSIKDLTKNVTILNQTETQNLKAGDGGIWFPILDRAEATEGGIWFPVAD